MTGFTALPVEHTQEPSTPKVEAPSDSNGNGHLAILDEMRVAYRREIEAMAVREQ